MLEFHLKRRKVLKMNKNIKSRNQTMGIDTDLMPKTMGWLTMTELAKYFVGGTSKNMDIIFKNLKELHARMPDKIQYRKLSNRYVGLCLHISALDDFSRICGLTSRGTVAPKTAEWLCETDLIKYFVGKNLTNGPIIRENLSALQNSMSGKIKPLCAESGRIILCLHISAIDDFARASGLTQKGAQYPKTDDWLSVSDLIKRFIGDTQKNYQLISAKLKEYQCINPGNVQLRKPKNKFAILCLHISAIDSFSAYVGLKRCGVALPRTDEWLDRTKLLEYLVTDFRKLSMCLHDLSSEMPKEIQYRRTVQGNIVICLHIDGLKEFARRTGIKIRDRSDTENFNIDKSTVLSAGNEIELKKYQSTLKSR